MFTPFENYVGDSGAGRFPQTCETAPEKRARKIEVAQRYARMLEDARLTVCGTEGRAVVKEALEHYCRYLMESL